MNPAFAMMAPPAPSFVSLASKPKMKVYSHLETLANISRVYGEDDKDDAPKNPKGSRERQLVKPGLDQPVALVPLDFCYTEALFVALHVRRSWGWLGLGHVKDCAQQTGI